MSFDKKGLLEVLTACLVGTSVAFFAGAAFAQDTVPDGVFDIEDDKESDATGRVTADGSEFGAFAKVECSPPSTTNGADGSSIFIRTEHPDAVKGKKNKMEVEQSQKENLPKVIVLTGGGTGTITADLTCEKASVDASVDTKKNTGKFSAKAKNCTCVVGDDNSQAVCDAHEARLEQVATDCDGFDSLKGDIDGNTIKKIKIKGKGTAKEQTS
jgi:hypothetical protein